MNPLNIQERHKRKPSSSVHPGKRIENREDGGCGFRQDEGGRQFRPHEQHYHPYHDHDPRKNFKAKYPAHGKYYRSAGMFRPPGNTRWVRDHDERREGNGRQDAQTWVLANERDRTPAGHNNHRFHTKRPGVDKRAYYNNTARPHNNNGWYNRKEAIAHTAHRRTNPLPSSADGDCWDWEVDSAKHQPASMSQHTTPSGDNQRMDSHHHHSTRREALSGSTSSSGNACHESYPEHRSRVVEYFKNRVQKYPFSATHRSSHFPRYNPDLGRNDKQKRYSQTSQFNQPLNANKRQGRYFSTGSVGTETETYSDASTLRSTTIERRWVPPKHDFLDVASTSTTEELRLMSPRSQLSDVALDKLAYHQKRKDNSYSKLSCKKREMSMRTLECRRGKLGVGKELKMAAVHKSRWENEYKHSKISSVDALDNTGGLKSGFFDQEYDNKSDISVEIISSDEDFENANIVEKQAAIVKVEPKNEFEIEPGNEFKIGPKIEFKIEPKIEPKSPTNDNYNLIKNERIFPNFKRFGEDEEELFPITGERPMDIYYTPYQPFHEYSRLSQQYMAEIGATTRCKFLQTSTYSNKTPMYSDNETEDPNEKSAFRLSPEEKSGATVVKKEKVWKPPLIIDMTKKSHPPMKTTCGNQESGERISLVQGACFGNKYSEKPACNSGRQLERIKRHHSRIPGEKEVIDGPPSDPRLRHPRYKEKIPLLPQSTNFCALQIKQERESDAVQVQKTQAGHYYDSQLQKRREHTAVKRHSREMSDQVQCKEMDKRVVTNPRVHYDNGEKKTGEGHQSNFEKRHESEGESGRKMSLPELPSADDDASSYVSPVEICNARIKKLLSVDVYNLPSRRLDIYKDNPDNLTDEQIIERFPRAAEFGVEIFRKYMNVDLDKLEKREDKLMAIWIQMRGTVCESILMARELKKQRARRKEEMEREYKETMDNLRRRELELSYRYT